MFVLCMHHVIFLICAHSLQLVRVSNATSGGKKKSQRALVVVGNRNGAAGELRNNVFSWSSFLSSAMKQ